MLRKALLASAMSAMIAPSIASAALVINGGVAGQIGDFGLAGNLNNDVVIDVYGSGTILNGFFDADISVDQDTALTFEFVGKEAGYTNIFSASNTAGTSTGSISNNDAVGTSFDLHGILAGILNFDFLVSNTGDGVANGANNDAVTKYLPDFWVGWDPDNAGSLLVAFDDGGANPDDDNHDDMVIRISQVPEPGTLGLIGLGLVGLGAVRRKNA